MYINYPKINKNHIFWVPFKFAGVIMAYNGFAGLCQTKAPSCSEWGFV
jgi:hypothetical protein